MKIPMGWEYHTTDGVGGHLTHETTAHFFTEDGLTLTVTHQTAEQTLFQVREGHVAGFDFQNRESAVGYGWHRTPEAAFRFAEAFIADGGEDYVAEPGRTSPRYSRAVSVAYAPQIRQMHAEVVAKEDT